MRTVTNLNDGWYFTKDDIDPSAPPLGSMQRITLPHTWNAEDGSNGNEYYRARCWYAREIEWNTENDECYIEFMAVSQTAEVFLNGKKLCTHEGGFSAFRVRLTDEIKPGKNLLVVSADNGENQRTYPQFADFTFYGGIYRDVHMISVPHAHFDLDYHGGTGLRVRATPTEASAEVDIEVYTKAADGCLLSYEILSAEGERVFSAESTDTLCTATLKNPRLWRGRSDPYLYTARVTMPSGDCVESTFGIRSFSVDADRGFFLNGESYPLHGVSRHQCRDGVGWAQSRADHEQDIKLITEMGANTVRLAHYQHSQDFYDLCDRYGVVAWAEIPFISSFMPTPEARANTIGQMTELVIQNYNHPSVCFWGISNEISMGGDDDENLNDNLRELNDLCHRLDPTRLTTIANLSTVENDSPHNHITDIVAYNHYFGWYVGSAEENGPWLDRFHAENPTIPLALSEYGAEGNYLLHSDTPEVRDYSEEYQCVYHEIMLKTFETRPYLWATYVWNMFEFASAIRDEGGVKGRNNKGLVSFDRKVKKDAYFLHKAYWTCAPFAYICSRRYLERCGESTSVKVYSAGTDRMELFINEKKAGEAKGSRIFLFEGVVLNMGDNTVTAVGFKNDSEVCRDEIPLKRVSSPNESYRLPEETPPESGNNVANWFDGELKSEMTFDPAYLSVNDKFGAVMEYPEVETMMKEMFVQMTGGEGSGIKINKGMLKMMSNMTFRDLIKMAGKRVPAGSLEMINAKLQQIKK